MSTKTNKKISFSKIKDLGSIDIKDIFRKPNEDGELEKKKSNKKVKEMAKNVVAIDIGSNFIKMGEGRYYKGKLRVTNLLQIPTPEGAVTDGKILDSEILGEIIQYAFKGYGIRAKEGIITTNSSSIINREVIIPKVSDEEIETVTRYEIQQYLPINLDNYIVEFIVLQELEEETGIKLKLNVITFPEQVALGYYQLLNSLEKNPYALDVSYNSIKKLATYTEIGAKKIEGEENTVTFVDMGATTVNVTIIKNDKVDFNRIIKFGGNNINNALNEKLNISIKGTESAKIQKSSLLEEDEYDEFNQVVRDSIDDFLDEFQRVLQFYNNKSGGNPVDKIFIYGGTANLKGLSTYMTKKLNKEVEKISFLKHVELNARKVIGEPVWEYLNVIGSIIRL
ncbi:type IV pilus assembly protein PilM [Clostridium sp. HBUAS56017]|uniref:type IV pilus assembly protein PilM n=1 Tax=Clostridium sp. HBUAS56017 TaxID=2571128 RepID=UPI0011787CB1|nr:type IV pilus assembly protein PilM [Clostridium sp. HBUAS56017]